MYNFITDWSLLQKNYERKFKIILQLTSDLEHFSVILSTTATTLDISSTAEMQAIPSEWISVITFSLVTCSYLFESYKDRSESKVQTCFLTIIQHMENNNTD